MTEKKSRSAFVPILLLVVGVVVCAGVALPFAPIVECVDCQGLGFLFFKELDVESEKNAEELADLRTGSPDLICVNCSASGKISAIRRWELSEDPTLRMWYLYISKEDVGLIKQNRQSNP